MERPDAPTSDYERGRSKSRNLKQKSHKRAREHASSRHLSGSEDRHGDLKRRKHRRRYCEHDTDDSSRSRSRSIPRDDMTIRYEAGNAGVRSRSPDRSPQHARQTSPSGGSAPNHRAVSRSRSPSRRSNEQRHSSRSRSPAKHRSSPRRSSPRHAAPSLARASPKRASKSGIEDDGQPCTSSGRPDEKDHAARGQDVPSHEPSPNPASDRYAHENFQIRGHSAAPHTSTQVTAPGHVRHSSIDRERNKASNRRSRSRSRSTSRSRDRHKNGSNRVGTRSRSNSRSRSRSPRKSRLYIRSRSRSPGRPSARASSPPKHLRERDDGLMQRKHRLHTRSRSRSKSQSESRSRSRSRSPRKNKKEKETKKRRNRSSSRDKKHRKDKKESKGKDRSHDPHTKDKKGAEKGNTQNAFVTVKSQTIRLSFEEDEEQLGSIEGDLLPNPSADINRLSKHGNQHTTTVTPNSGSTIITRAVSIEDVQITASQAHPSFLPTSMRAAAGLLARAASGNATVDTTADQDTRQVHPVASRQVPVVATPHQPTQGFTLPRSVLRRIESGASHDHTALPVLPASLALRNAGVVLNTGGDLGSQRLLTNAMGSAAALAAASSIYLKGRPTGNIRLADEVTTDSSGLSDTSDEDTVHGKTGKLGRVVFGVAQARCGRPYMEDRHTCISCWRPLNGASGRPLDDGVERSYVGVFDGHNGSRTAEEAAARMHTLLAADPVFRTHTGEVGPPATMAAQESAVSGAIKKAFRALDDDVLRQAAQDGGRDGATALVLLRLSDSLYCAHAGDSRAVLCQANGKAFALTRDHKPDLPSEKLRVESVGGRVEFQKCWRVVVEATPFRPGSGLAVSRSLGDPDFKHPSRFVECEPDVKRYTPKPGDAFVVLATDGLWDVLSNQDAVDVVKQALQTASRGAGVLNTTHATAAAEAALNLAVKRGTLDNVTVVVMAMTWGSL